MFQALDVGFRLCRYGVMSLCSGTAGLWLRSHATVAPRIFGRLSVP
jgi:hypothetical protein